MSDSCIHGFFTRCAACREMAQGGDLSRAPADGWRDIASAPRDGTSVLLLLKDTLPEERNSAFAGLQFVARHPGLADDGFDIGWNFAAPVGMGGFPDAWIAGWQPLPLTGSPRAPADGRTPQDFAIEFAEYMAKAAEFYFENHMAADPDLRTDAHHGLKTAIYEFRKRIPHPASRAPALAEEWNAAIEAAAKIAENDAEIRAQWAKNNLPSAPRISAMYEGHSQIMQNIAAAIRSLARTALSSTPAAKDNNAYSVKTHGS